MPKCLLDVLGERMDLEREVAATHRVEKIEADGELVAETGMHRVAQQAARLIEDEVDRRQSPTAASPNPRSRLFSSGTQSKHQP